MDAVHEAIRKLMGTKKELKEQLGKEFVEETILEDKAENEKNDNAVPNRVKKRRWADGKILPELWDQVYCSLTDCGENEVYAICGGKGKYSIYDISVNNERGKFEDTIISVVYDRYLNEEMPEDFFKEAKRVAKKFGVKTTTTSRLSRYIFFNLFIPREEPVYFDLIPQKFWKKIAKQNDEFLDNLPTSPSYDGPPLAVEGAEIKEQIEEDLDIADLPVTVLPESEIKEFIHNVPKATKYRGPASLTFTIGFVTDLDRSISSQYKENGRGNINKETGEAYPVVNIIKCSEITRLYLEDFSSSKRTIAHRKQKDRFNAYQQQEMGAEEEAPKRQFASWLESTEEHDSLKRSKKTGELVLVPLMARNSRTRNKYFISFDGGPLKETNKQEVAQYLTPAKAAELLSGRDLQAKFGPNGEQIIDPAQPLNFYLKKIYRIGDKGTSIF